MGGIVTSPAAPATAGRRGAGASASGSACASAERSSRASPSRACTCATRARPNPFAKGDATVTYTIHNTGNAILTARQAVSVSGPFGRWAVGCRDDPRLAVAAAGRHLEDVRAAARRGSRAQADGDRHARPAAHRRGGLDRAARRHRRDRRHAWAIPWTLLLGVVVLCGLVAAGVAFALRRRRRRARLAPRAMRERELAGVARDARGAVAGGGRRREPLLVDGRARARARVQLGRVRRRDVAREGPRPHRARARVRPARRLGRRRRARRPRCSGRAPPRSTTATRSEQAAALDAPRRRRSSPT